MVVFILFFFSAAYKTNKGTASARGDHYKQMNEDCFWLQIKEIFSARLSYKPNNTKYH